MTFEELKLKKTTLKALKDLGFEKPTPIQKSSIPVILKGDDVVGQSLTGSGKTAAFGIPAVEIANEKKQVQVLVLVPVRELAVQVKERIKSFSEYTNLKVGDIYGGVGMGPQQQYLRNCEIIVATPGRILDHIQRGNANFNNMKLLVIDEADKMFEMGFIDDVNKIISNLPKTVQKTLFSATMPAPVKKLIDKHLNHPQFIQEEIHVNKDLLTQVYYEVQPKQKFSLLVHLLKNKTEGLAIVFCGRRSEVDIISSNLKNQGIKCLPVHGGLTQNKRLQAVSHLKKENIQVLVATDVAARGLDINNISHIYNYDSPKNASEYTHRIGRTARAGQKGEAVTLLTHRDHDNFRNVLSDRNLKIKKAPTPEFERAKFVQPERRSGGAGGPKRRFSRGGNRSKGSGGRSRNRSSSDREDRPPRRGKSSGFPKRYNNRRN